jgi:hypothetical protein
MRPLQFLEYWELSFAGSPADPRQQIGDEYPLLALTRRRVGQQITRGAQTEHGATLNQSLLSGSQEVRFSVKDTEVETSSRSPNGKLVNYKLPEQKCSEFYLGPAFGVGAFPKRVSFVLTAYEY